MQYCAQAVMVYGFIYNFLILNFQTQCVDVSNAQLGKSAGQC